MTDLETINRTMMYFARALVTDLPFSIQALFKITTVCLEVSKSIVVHVWTSSYMSSIGQLKRFPKFALKQLILFSNRLMTFACEGNTDVWSIIRRLVKLKFLQFGYLCVKQSQTGLFEGSQCCWLTK